MTPYKKPSLGLTPRHFWLRQRVIDCIASLKRLEDQEDWEIYRKYVYEFSQELSYAVTEWEKYYNDNQ